MGNLPPSTSPFNSTNLKPLGVYRQRGRHFALKMSDGSILVNFDSTTSYKMLSTLARIAQAEVVVVHGEWTFVPDTYPAVAKESNGEEEA